MKSCGCEVGRYCRECINTAEPADAPVAAAIYVEKSMSTRATLSLVLFALLVLAIVVTVATGGCEQAAQVACEPDAYIDGHNYGGCDATLREHYIDECMKTGGTKKECTDRAIESIPLK